MYQASKSRIFKYVIILFIKYFQNMITMLCMSAYRSV